MKLQQSKYCIYYFYSIGPEVEGKKTTGQGYFWGSHLICYSVNDKNIDYAISKSKILGDIIMFHI